MGNIIPAQAFSAAGVVYSSSTAGVIRFRAVTTGLVRSVRLWADEVTLLAVRPVILNMRINGVPQWTKEEQMFGMNTEILSSAKLGLARPITRGMLVQVDIYSSNGTIRDITVLMETEES